MLIIKGLLGGEHSISIGLELDKKDSTSFWKTGIKNKITGSFNESSLQAAISNVVHPLEANFLTQAENMSSYTHALEKKFLIESVENNLCDVSLVDAPSYFNAHGTRFVMDSNMQFESPEAMVYRNEYMLSQIPKADITIAIVG